MVGREKRVTTDLDDRPVSEARPRPRRDGRLPAAGERRQAGVEREPPERDKNAHPAQNGELRVEVVAAGGKFHGQRPVVRRRAPDRRGDHRAGESEAIAGPD
jgi:hypothetical protein